MDKIFNFQFSIFKKEWGRIFFVWIGIVIVFFLLRLINLTIFPIFADEAIYIRWAQVMRAEPTLRFLPLSDGKQPLFMWLMMPLFSLFQDPLIAGRILSIFAGLGTLIGISILSLILFRSKIIMGLVAILYSVVPFTVFFDRLALVDSLLTMFGVWVMVFGTILARYERLDLAMVCGFLLGGALLTKSPAVFFLVLLPACVLVRDPRQKRSLPLQLIKLILLLGVSYFFAFLIYSILRLGPGFEMIALRNKDYVFSIPQVLSHPLDPFVPHIGQVWEWFVVFFGKPIILTFFGGMIVSLAKYPKQTILLTGWLLFPLLAQMTFAKVFTARYIYFVIPPFLLLSAVFLYWLWEKIRKTKMLLAGKVGIVTAVILVLAAPIFSFNRFLLTDPPKIPLPRGERSGYLEEWSSGYGIPEVRDYLKRLPKAEGIVVGTEGSFGTLPDGLQIYFDKDKGVTIVGVGLGLDKVPEPLLDSASKGTPTFLVVNRSRMRAQNDPRLKLIFQVSKAKGDKELDFLQFYQVK